MKDQLKNGQWAKMFDNLYNLLFQICFHRHSYFTSKGLMIMKMLKTMLMLLLPVVMIIGDESITLLEAFSIKEVDEAQCPGIKRVSSFHIIFCHQGQWSMHYT